jgi:ribosomal protein S18 acetylase RimI-like enzyme
MARSRALEGLQVDTATVDDCRAIAELHVRAWQQAYRGIVPQPYLDALSVAERESMWRGMVENGPGLLLARAAGQVAGFVAFGASRDEGAAARCAELFAIYVAPAFWSGGVGHRLWLAARQQLAAQGYETVTLWVLAGNERAIRFYERAGFVAEPGSRRPFELGGAVLQELRYGRPCGD